MRKPDATVVVLEQPPWTPFKFASKYSGGMMFCNSRYQVARYTTEDHAADGWPRVVHLSFKHHTNIAITDFRDMQLIKNELVGPSSFAVQIFPQEEHLVDTANQYHLWALVPDQWEALAGAMGGPLWTAPADCMWPALPFGFREGRVLAGSHIMEGGNQRAFAEEHMPDDLASQEQHLHRMVEKYNQLIKGGASEQEAKEYVTAMAQAERGMKR